VKNLYFLVLALVLLLGFIVRLYRFTGPIADWHSWRQADTSSVSRNFVTYGFDLLHPRFDDLSNVPSGLDNPKGYRFVEFPIYNAFQAGAFKLFNHLTLEEWGRLITISLSLLTSVFLFLIVKKHLNSLTGLLVSFFFLFLPFNIYYSRTILPDEGMVTAIIGGIYFFDRWISRDKLKLLDLNFVATLLFTAASFLLKPYALFFTLPIIFLAFNRFGIKVFTNWRLWVFLVLSVIPLIFWRIWMLQYPEGIPVSNWLFNGGGIRFKGAFFYWLFADRLSRLILGYWGLPLLILGVLAKLKRTTYFFFLSFIASSLLYLFVIARGNVQHDYYQILIVPTIAIFLGIGGEFLLRSSKERFNKAASYIIFVLCVCFMLSFGWYFARDYFNINNSSIIIAGQAVDRLTSKNAKVIAPYDGDTSFLYQTKRAGWASFEKPLPDMIKIGADYLVLVNPAKKDYDIGKTYRIIGASPQYLIFDLHKNP
jgi:hypothetical protein